PFTPAPNDLDEAATAVILTPVAVDENDPGAKLADVAADDPDGAPAAAEFSLEGEDAALFALVDGENGVELVLAEGVSLDFEAAEQPSVTVVYQGIASEPFTPAPADVEEAATSMTLTPVSVDENLAGAVVAQVDVEDPDGVVVAADLTLSGPDQDLFELVDGESGIELKLVEGASLDFEAPAQPQVTVSIDGLSEDFTPAPNDVLENGIQVFFDQADLMSYSGQDRPGQFGTGANILDDGATLELDGNLWKRAKLNQDFEITADTQLQVDLMIGDALPEIVGIGFDADDNPFNQPVSLFRLAGNQGGSLSIDVRNQGEDLGDGKTRFLIDLSGFAGQTINSLVFVSDDDNPGNGEGSSIFSNVLLLDGAGINTPPRVVGNGVADQTIDEGQALEVDLAFTDDDGDPLTFSFTVVDENGIDVTDNFGLSLNDGVLTGTPPAETEPGEYTVTATADDGIDQTNDVFTITIQGVNEAPIAENPGFEPLSGAVGEPIEPIDISDFFIAFSDPDGDALTFTVEGLPDGLELNEEGVIVGTPTEQGEGSFTIVGTDPGGLEARLDIDLTLEAPTTGDVTSVEAEDFTGLDQPGALNFFPTGQAGASNEMLIRVGTDEKGSVTTQLSQNGLLPGHYTVQIDLYDETDGNAMFSLDIGGTVLADNLAIDSTGDFLNPGEQRGTGGQIGNLKRISFEEVVSIDASTIATLSGMADDEVLRIDRLLFTRVEAPDEPPFGIGLDNASVDENADGAVIGALSATDPEGTQVSFSVDPSSDFELDGDTLKLKDGVSLDHEQTDEVDVIVTALDGAGSTSTATLTVTVNDVNEAPTLADGAALADESFSETTGGTVDLTDLGLADEDEGDIPVYEVRGANGSTLPDGFSVDGDTLTVPAGLAPGDYALEVIGTDGEFETEAVPFNVTITEDVSQPEVIGLAGSESFIQSNGDTWFSVSFDVALDDPAVIAGPLSTNGAQQASVRIRNVSEDGFEYQLDEWDYLDGFHIEETLSWVAIESGRHTLDNGAVIEAGTGLGGTEFAGVSFSSAFDAAPVVFGQATSDNGPAAITTRLDDVSANGFSFKFQEEEAADQVHPTEDLGWIAVSAGSFDGLAAGTTGETVTHLDTTINLGAGFDAADSFLLADMQTFNGPDTATVRLRDQTSGTATVFIEEETSADAETNHLLAEQVGWLVLDDDQLLA
ncbi:MAG: putative Ig domain-containing protein, partial [Pseudomonadota bacterium]